MIHKILLGCYLLVSVTLFAQEKVDPLQRFDTSAMQTNVLVFQSPIVDIQTYNEKTIDLYSFYQAYKSIDQGDLEGRLFPLDQLKTLRKESYATNIIPLSLLNVAYENIAVESLQDNSVYRDSQGFLMNDGGVIFERHQLTIASPLRASHKGLEAKFRLSNAHIFNLSDSTISGVEVDFGEGNGFQNVNADEVISVNYSDEGQKVIRFKITLSDGSVLLRDATIMITYSNEDWYTRSGNMINTFSSSITPDLSPYGESTSYAGTGEYEIFLSSDNVLDKPIFLVDGFDPGDGRQISGIYELLNFDDEGVLSNLGDIVREQGYDVVIINFPVYFRAQDNSLVDGGADFIERNAMLLVDLINLINTDKVGNEENVVIGPSMGGLISRYALAYMEDQNMDHDTRLWISFDSPHLGANVPIGFQHQFNFLAFGLDDFWILGDQNVEELQPIIDGMLKSPAARQMLTDQFESHITDSDGVTFNGSLSLPQPHFYKPILDNRFGNLTASGFPESTRNISIINGSGNNSRYQNNGNPASDLFPGSQILDADINVMTGADLKVETYLTPYASTTIQMSKVHLDFAWWFPLANDRINNASASAHSYSNGIDAASGGLFDILGLTTDLDTGGLVGEFLGSLSTDYFNFIPSVSAMALVPQNNQIDWFESLSGVTTNDTPFVNWYMPIENEPHVTLTDGNVTFALDEIIQETLSNTDVKVAIQLSLGNNPIKNELVLISPQVFKNVKIDIIDITGKIVYSKIIDEVSNRTVLPINLSSGLYVVDIKGETDQLLRTKLIVDQ
ncbi:MAG: T9SS type A sorting domain-containing protein [Psychroserpens sp.]|nr:T9SS type A sorting domain-containing protein [Psychroserpens sp.]